MKISPFILYDNSLRDFADRRIKIYYIIEQRGI